MKSETTLRALIVIFLAAAVLFMVRSAGQGKSGFVLIFLGLALICWTMYRSRTKKK